MIMHALILLNSLCYTSIIEELSPFCICHVILETKEDQIKKRRMRFESSVLRLGNKGISWRIGP